MKFVISRTGTYGNTPPCKEAKKEVYAEVDERTTDDPRKIPAHKGTDGDWYKRGKNHRVEKGHIKRDLDSEHYVIEINSLDELMNFIHKYGRIVVSPNAWRDDTLPEIEIYDDYRE